MKYLFLHALIFAFVHVAWSKNIQDFGQPERELILKFKNLALNSRTLPQALELLVATEKKIEQGQLAKGFLASDLVTTTYLSNYFDPSRESVLSDFCKRHYGKDPSTYADFYKTLLSKLKHSPDYYDDNGRTPLMALVQTPRYSEITPSWINHETSCEEWLLAADSSPLTINREPYDHNAFDIALVNHNQPVIALFIDWLKDNPQSLPWHTDELLRAYRGEVFQTTDILGMHRFRLYRVANQSGNFALVHKLYEDNQSFRTIQEDYLKRWQNDMRVQSVNHDSFYYPPLWAFNIVQLRDYARETIKKLSPYVIKREDLQPILNKPGLFRYRFKEEDLILMKKEQAPIVGRVLGALHLAEKGSSYGLPKKFIVAPTDGLTKVVFTVPGDMQGRHYDPMYTWGFVFDKTLGASGGLNAVNLEIPGAELYVEYIKGEHVLGRPDLGKGFVDAKSNVIERSSDHKQFIIDTGDDKNFLTPIGNLKDAYEIKILHFAPDVRKVTIDLAK